MALAAGNWPGFHGFMAGFALEVEGVLERRAAAIGLHLMAGIAGLPLLSAAVIEIFIKIMMAPRAVQLVFRVELMIEFNEGPLMLPHNFMIEQEGVIL